jgi:hypothetical protein
MSTNDDSASRRGRRADQGERRGPARQERDERWEQSSIRDRAGGGYQDQAGRDNQRAAYSNFSRHAYAPQEPAPNQPQGHYPEPAPRNEPPRYVEPAAPSFAPPPYEPEPPHLNYHEASRDDLFARETPPGVYEQPAYGSQGAGYQGDPYDPNRGHQTMTQPVGASRRDEQQHLQREPLPSPIDDYEHGFTARMGEEAQASRFYLPEDEPQKARAQQGAYAPPPPSAAQQYSAGGYPPQDPFSGRYGNQENWVDEHPLHEENGGAAALQHDAHGNELDEDFFADEDDLDHDHDHLPAPKRGRKKLIAAALIGAIAIGGGGAYFYKSVKGGGAESATPILRADSRPMKEVPGNPGGKQFPNGEKTIYDRLTPDGQQVQMAGLAPAQAAPDAAPAPAGNSLEERIDEALRKAQRSGDSPQPFASASRGADQPTVVRSESYRPDGTRVDGARPFVTPSVVDMSGGQLPAPFGNAAPAPAQPQLAAPFKTAPVPSLPAPQAVAPAPAPKNAQPTSRTASITPVEAAPPASGFYVSLKSAPDEKAIQKDLGTLTDKYKSVLGDTQLSSKIADLGAKGVTYRAVAGPLGTRQQAMDLCQKIKGAGGSCFVTN